MRLALAIAPPLATRCHHTPVPIPPGFEQATNNVICGQFF